MFLASASRSRGTPRPLAGSLYGPRQTGVLAEATKIQTSSRPCVRACVTRPWCRSCRASWWRGRGRHTGRARRWEGPRRSRPADEDGPVELQAAGSPMTVAARARGAGAGEVAVPDRPARRHPLPPRHSRAPHGPGPQSSVTRTFARLANAGAKMRKTWQTSTVDGTQCRCQSLSTARRNRRPERNTGHDSGPDVGETGRSVRKFAQHCSPLIAHGPPAGRTQSRHPVPHSHL